MNTNLSPPEIQSNFDSRYVGGVLCQIGIGFEQIIIGDSGVGKSSLLIRFVRNEYHEQTRSTISAAYLTRRVETPERAVQFEIWDTAGQERFRSLNTPMYYRGAAGAVIVYDISDPNSFKNARGWFTQLKMLGEKGVKVVLVGNKADLEHKRGVDDAVAEEFAQQNGLVSCQFLQCFLVPIEDI
jgi:small GTP-binding protein